MLVLRERVPRDLQSSVGRFAQRKQLRPLIGRPVGLVDAQQQPAVERAQDHAVPSVAPKDRLRKLFPRSADVAAPQVGRNIRVFVVDASVNADEDPRLAGFRKTFINARIYERSGEEVLYGEGCLSLPRLNEDVSRPERIRIRYVDEHFVEHDEEYDGFAARVIQHEYDHLDGKLFVDRLSPLRKTLIKGKLAAMAKGKYKAAYKTKLVRK